MRQVYPAEPYRPSELGSFGSASYMLIRQFQFPDTHEDHEPHHYWDSDRCFQNDFKHARRCFEQHTGTGELGLADWAGRASDTQIINFIVDILKAKPHIMWTGYRILGTVNRGNGFPVWTLSVFAKDPKSTTKVYTGSIAPNVLSCPRYE